VKILTRHMIGTFVPGVTAITIALLLSLTATAMAATEAPVKEILSSHIGWETDKTTKGKICTTESKHECQPGIPSSQPGGFEFPKGIAVATGGNVYVGDTNNQRVQELTQTGEFVSMFGKNVNSTTGGDTCTAASHDICKAGEGGTAAGEFGEPESVAVDQGGDVYVLDLINWRVEKFTPAGEFALMFGKDVNETTGGDICTAGEIKSGIKCKEGVRSAAGSTEHGAFKFGQFKGNLLAVGGSEELLYVGDEGRVQEFEADGKWKAEVPLPSESTVTAVAVENNPSSLEFGDVYVNDNGVILKFKSNGEKLTEFAISADGGMTVDSSNRLALTLQTGTGSLYDGKTGQLITEFAAPFGNEGIAFNNNDELYDVSGQRHEIVRFTPLPVAELHASPVSCAPGPEHGTDATFDCSLNGTVNPWGVPETEIFFQWGKTVALGTDTPRQPVEESEPGKAIAVGASMGSPVPPNERSYYRLAGYDHNLEPPENPLRSETMSFETPTVPPRIVGEPSASFVKPFSAVLFGELNPENASTAYFFEYGPCDNLENCSEVIRTTELTSATYGEIGASLEVKALQPATLYHYRLVAVNDKEQETKGPPGEFITALAPVPQAATGTVTEGGSTSATISGTVNPDGQPAIYIFELGIYHGAATQYGTVLSGSAGAGMVPTTKIFTLSGLQPATTYAYKIVVKSSYGTAEGEPVIFTTAGLPALLTIAPPLTTLSIPNTHFPNAGTSKAKLTCKRGHKRDRHGKCVKVKKRNTKGNKTPVHRKR
jgi:hypothetical protein